jgi:hypothetical protein
MKQVILARRPVGMPTLDDFTIVERKVPDIRGGELLIRARYLSVDPLQRVRMAPSSTYGQTMPLDEVVWGRMVGEVIDSRNADYRVGEFVEGMLGWSEYAVSDGSTAKAEYAPGLTRVDPDRAPISTALGILGMPGVTAYFSLLEIGQPKVGETVLVSAAAGMVGSLAGQIARIKGCRVVGIAGGKEKTRYIVDDLGFDAAIDYKAGIDMVEAIRAACPDGVDVYMDNVGGPIRDAALRTLNRGARVPLVGRISQMHDASPVCPDPQVPLMHARARMEGFIVYDYEHRAEEASSMIATWLRSGELRYRETVTHDIESAPSAFISMLAGGNIGKQIVKL